MNVLDSAGSGSDATIATAITAAADAGAQVISMSLGGAGYSQTLQTAINYAWQRNSVVIAAAGNSATAALFFPAGKAMRSRSRPRTATTTWHPFRISGPPSGWPRRALTSCPPSRATP